MHQLIAERAALRHDLQEALFTANQVKGQSDKLSLDNQGLEHENQRLKTQHKKSLQELVATNSNLVAAGDELDMLFQLLSRTRAGLKRVANTLVKDDDSVVRLLDRADRCFAFSTSSGLCERESERERKRVSE